MTKDKILKEIALCKQLIKLVKEAKKNNKYAFLCHIAKNNKLVTEYGIVEFKKLSITLFNTIVDYIVEYEKFNNIYIYTAEHIKEYINSTWIIGYSYDYNIRIKLLNETIDKLKVKLNKQAKSAMLKA